MQKYMVRFVLSGGSKLLKYCVLSFITLSIGMLLWLSFSTGYYSSLAVTYGRYDFPFITAMLEGKKFELTVDIGSRFPLSLRKELLDGIDKQFKGTVTVRDMNGGKNEVPSYLIPVVKIGDLTLKNIVANQIIGEDQNSLGKFLGEEFNLFLDFSHSRIIACDTFSKLQSKKLVDNHWKSNPFEMSLGGPIFNVDTDFGTLRLALNTTSTVCFLRSSLLSSDQVSSPFSLEGQQYGMVSFHSLDFPEGLDGIDGFIGMEFLKKHAVYLDYTHKVAYFEPPAKYFERIPITFASRGHATINVSIEENVYPLEIDLGFSFFMFSLSQEILQNIQKEYYGTANWYDFRGQDYESLAYTIPEIKIGNLTFANRLVNQNSEDFHINATVTGVPSQPMGSVGCSILEKYNLFLDFPHSSIYACSDCITLQQAGLLSKNLLTIPFNIHPDGILLSVDTDDGTYQFLLDTGATRTVIRAPHSTPTAQFRIAGHDFGTRSIVPIGLTPKFDFDGCLGLDFIREYPIFIDYPNKLIYLDLQKDQL